MNDKHYLLTLYESRDGLGQKEKLVLKLMKTCVKREASNEETGMSPCLI